MPESTFTMRLDTALKDAFTEAARTHDRTAAQLLRDFMRNYITQNQRDADYDTWFYQKVEQGRQAYFNGQFVPNEVMEAEAKARCERLLHGKTFL